ncbi:autophagy-related protein 13, partial [Phenoliferia sp. Uapishka_3]
MESLLGSSQRSASPPPSPYPYSSATNSASPGLSRAGSRTTVPAENADVAHGASGAQMQQGSAPIKRGPVADERREKDGKADQIVQHFYAKTCAVVSQARMTHVEDTSSSSASSGGQGATSSPLSSGLGQPGRRGSRASSPPLRRGASAGAGAATPTKRTNRWFNLELSDTDHFRAELKTWRSVSSLLSPSPSPLPSPSPSSHLSSVPPMILDIILDTCGMTPNQVLVLSDNRGRRFRVDSSPMSSSPGPQSPSGIGSSGVRSPRITRPNVILERWTLSLVPPYNPTSSPELPSVYKAAIILFRTLFTLVRTLPAWGLYRRLARRKAGVGGAGLQIGCRMSMGEESEREGEVGVDVGIAEKGGEKTTETFVFPGVKTPIGTLVLNCTYRLNAEFSVEAIETLLSSTFIDQDFFKPTMARYHQDALSGRPGSLPISGGRPQPHPVSSSPPGVRGQTYGSLSSRHQVAPTPVPFPSISTVQGPPPSSEPETPPESAGSSSRYGSYGGGIEPAFVSLSRARGTSYFGGIQRVGLPPKGKLTGEPKLMSATFITLQTPLSSSPSSQPIRRPSLTSISGSSGSPIFRPGSYLSSPPLSSSPLTGPTSNINRVSSSPRSITQSSGVVSGTSTAIGSRSPLGAPSPQSTPTPPRPILGAAVSGSSGSQPMRPYSSGSYSRSYGRGSSGGSISGGEASATWGGRGGSSRLSFEGRYGSIGRTTTVIHHTDGAGAVDSGEQKRFLETAEDDSDDINSFLGLIDTRPELVKSATAATAASAILSKTQADETLRRLMASVQLANTPNEGVGGGIVRASSLRHQSSRHSIQEEESASGSHIERVEPSTSSSPRLPSHLNPSRYARRSSIPTFDQPSTSTGSSPTPNYFSSTPPNTLVTAGSSSTSPSSLSFPKYIPRSTRTVGPSQVTTGFVLSHGQQQQQHSIEQPAPPPLTSDPASSTASLSGNEGSGTSHTLHSRNTSFGEEEAVGRLELEDEGGDEMLRGRGRWEAETEDGPEGDAARMRSRDRTPGSTLRRPTEAIKYRRSFYQQDEDEGRGLSPEISWMG